MLTPLRDKNNRGPVARMAFLPFPWRGLNTRDRLEAVGPEYAQIIDNLNIAGAAGEVRKGFSLYATGNAPASSVGALMVYNGAGADKLFLAAGGNIDNITAGNPGAADVSGLSGDDWVGIMYSTTSGTYLVAANGTDSVREYDGSAWSTPAITGVTSADLKYVYSHKGRLWFVEKASMSLWYLATNAISGAATEFPIGSLCERGGDITAIHSWSSDSGDGLDDRLVIITSEGEILVYAGVDPGSDYVLSGIFHTDKPVGKRCFARFSGEVIIFTVRGPQSLTEITTGRNIAPDSFGSIVRPDFEEAWRSDNAQPGWEAFAYPSRGWLVFNVPTTYGTEISRQYVFQSSAWVRHRYQPALTFAEFNGTMYFGSTNGRVYKADFGTADDDGTGVDSSIVFDVMWGWSLFDTPKKKIFRGARVNITADVSVSPAIEMMVDYTAMFPTVIPTFAEVAGATWDVSAWDVTAWAGGTFTFSPFVGMFRTGHVGALRVRAGIDGPETYKIHSIIVTIEDGNFI